MSPQRYCGKCRLELELWPPAPAASQAIEYEIGWRAGAYQISIMMGSRRRSGGDKSWGDRSAATANETKYWSIRFKKCIHLPVDVCVWHCPTLQIREIPQNIAVAAAAAALVVAVVATTNARLASLADFHSSCPAEISFVACCKGRGQGA